MPEHVVLVGLMGAGKSTVGRELAAVLGRPLVDNDVQILAMTGRTVAEINAQAGVAEMRRVERDALARALASPVPAVITAAAGVVLENEVRRWLREPFVVWLRADPTTLAGRVVSDPIRPFLGADAETVLRGMEEQRQRLFAEVADEIVDVDGRAPTELAAAIATRLQL